MEYQDYYATLGVPRTATQADIKKAFRKLAREHHPGQQAATRPPSSGSRRSTRPTRSCRIPRSASSTTSSARLGGLLAGRRDRRGRRPVRRRQPVRRLRRRRRRAAAGGRRPLRVPDGNGDAGGLLRLLPHVLRRRRPAGDRPAAAGPAPRTRPRRGRRRVVRGPPRRDGPRRRRRGRPAGAAGRAAPRRAPPAATVEADAEITLEEAFHGTKRLRRGRRQAPRGHDPARRRHGQRIRLSGKGAGGGDLVVTVKVKPHPVFTRDGADLERELPITPARGAARRRDPGHDAHGPGAADDPGRHPERPHVPAHGPGPAAPQGRRPRRPVRQGPRRPADRRSTTRPARPPRTFLDLVDQPDPRPTTDAPTTQRTAEDPDR